MGASGTTDRHSTYDGDSYFNGNERYSLFATRFKGLHIISYRASCILGKAKINMTEYHKIQTLFNRDMEGNKKLIEGNYRNPLIEYIKDCQWFFTEKVDGTNIRIIWDGHKVKFGGRTENAQLPMPLLERLTELFGGSTNEELFEQKFGETPVVIYGEGYGGKIQKGSGYKPTQDFIAFDVKIGDMFLERENVEDIVKSFGVPIVPILLTGTIEEGIQYVKDNQFSTIAESLDKESEGLVGLPLRRMRDERGDRVIVKIKARDFEVNHE